MERDLGVQKVRVFLASPSDTQAARDEIVQTVERINADPAYNRHLIVELLRWDDPQCSVPFSWLRNPQNEVVDYTGDPAGTHLLVAIFKHSFGSYLPIEEFGTSPDGDPWTGTEWEIAQAVEAASSGNHNEVWIYHDQSDFVLSDYPDKDSRDAAYAQFTRVSSFLEQARNPEGVIQRGYETYTGSIADVFDSRLRKWLAKHFIDPAENQAREGAVTVDSASDDVHREIGLQNPAAGIPHAERNTMPGGGRAATDAGNAFKKQSKSVPNNKKPTNKAKKSKMPFVVISVLALGAGALYVDSILSSTKLQEMETASVQEVPEGHKLLPDEQSSLDPGVLQTPEPTPDTELNQLGAPQNQCVSTAASITANIAHDQNSLIQIRDEIFEREAASQRASLIAWNIGEEFPSLGIGHFIWYPEKFQGPFTESFPMVIRYLKLLGHTIPEEFYLDGEVQFPPWKNAAELEKSRKSPRFQEFLDFLEYTGTDQARFAIDRFSGALGNIICNSDGSVNPKVAASASRVGAAANGLRHMMDYGMFKGEGTNPSERYHDEGWGLRQVFEEMDGGNPDALAAFRLAAIFVLQRRVDNAPITRDESRWMAGWKNRISSYQ